MPTWLLPKSCMYRGPPINPWLRLLNLRRDPNQQVFATKRSYQLDPDRQSFRRPMQRQGDRRLPGYVEGPGEEYVPDNLGEKVCELVFDRRHRFERRGRLPDCRG